MNSNLNNDTNDNIPSALIYKACPDFDMLVEQASIRRIWQLAFARLGQQRLPGGADIDLIDNEEKEVIVAETREMFRRSVARSIIKKQPFFKTLICNDQFEPEHVDPVEAEIAEKLMNEHISADIEARMIETELYNSNKEGE